MIFIYDYAGIACCSSATFVLISQLLLLNYYYEGNDHTVNIY